MAKAHIKPIYAAIACMVYMGKGVDEIAKRVNLSPAIVAQMIQTPAMQELIRRTEEGTLETLIDVKASLQAAAPLGLLGLIELAGSASNEAVRLKACQALTDRAGHAPARTLKIEQQKVEEDPETLTENEIRLRLTEGLEGSEDSNPTVH